MNAFKAKLLRPAPRPTAIFAGNDLMAMGVLMALRELGLRCPEDVSITGFDNLDTADLLHPPLTSVRSRYTGWERRRRSC